MLKRQYFCDLCDRQFGRDQKPLTELRGLYFSNLYDFKVSEYNTTDGKHVCIHCLDLIRKD